MSNYGFCDTCNLKNGNYVRKKKRQKKTAASKKMRNAAVSILRGISIRMPLLIYDADLNKTKAEEKTVNDKSRRPVKETLVKGLTPVTGVSYNCT